MLHYFKFCIFRALVVVIKYVDSKGYVANSSGTGLNIRFFAFASTVSTPQFTEDLMKISRCTHIEAVSC